MMCLTMLGGALLQHPTVGPPMFRTSFKILPFRLVRVRLAPAFLHLYLLLSLCYRYIKMSSPHLNNLIIIGCILTYLSVVFLGLDSGLSSTEAFPYICTTRAWLLMAGFSLAFGAMFSKTWRVHSIFTDVKLNKKVIKDYQLFMVVGVLLAIDIAILLTWQIADPFFRDTKQMEPYVSSPTGIF